MSINIPVAHVEQYRDNVIMLAQQKGTRLARTCRNDGEVIGRSVYYDRIGATNASQVTTRHADTPLTNTPHSRRRADMTDWDWADLVDRVDRLRTIYDPTNFYALNGAFAIGRALDDVIIDAMGGSVYEGQSGGTTTAFPSAQKIAAATAGLTLAKLISAREILDAAEVDPDYKRFLACTAEQISDLLNNTTVTSADYNNIKALVQGDINTFMGFEFIRTERLDVDGSNDRLCYAYTEAAMGIGMGEELMVDIGPRRDKRNATQVYVCASLACTRIEDAQIVQIACVES